MRTCLVRVAIVVATASASVGAQSLTLTESQALARLSSASPRVQAIRASVDLARTGVQAASRWPNPRATVNRETASGITEHVATISQILPVTGRRRLEVGAAVARVEAASSRAGEQVRRARTDLRLAFAALVTSQVRERELIDAAKRTHELAGVLERREAAGDASGFDRMRVEREALDADAARAAASVERIQAQGALAAFFETPSDILSIVAVPENAGPADLAPVEALIARAEATRGELLALGHDAESSRLAERAARRRLIPEPEIAAGTKSSDAGTRDVGGVLAVHSSIPLFDRARPEQAAARAQAVAATAHAAQFRLALRAEIAALRASVIERREAAERYRAGAASAAELERIARVRYEAGEQGILELLDAYRTGAAARVRQAELDLVLRQLEIELEFASGWEMP